MWDIDPRMWLRAYLEGCAQAGGKAPADVSDSLPWNMTAEARKAMQMFEDEVPQQDSRQDTS